MTRPQREQATVSLSNNPLGGVLQKLGFPARRRRADAAGIVRLAAMGGLLLVSSVLGETFYITSAADMAKAVASTQPTVNVIVETKVQLGHGYFSFRQPHVRILGIGRSAWLAFDPTWPDKVNGKATLYNGLEFRCEAAVVENVAITGFESCQGSCIKNECRDAFTITHCRFRDIGNHMWPPLTSQPSNAAPDWGYTQVIGSHVPTASVVISDCAFTRCCSNSMMFSHELYVNYAVNVTVVGCMFNGCGNPFALDNSQRVTCSRNRIENAAKTWYQWQDKESASYIASIGGEDATYTGLVVTTQPYCPWTGYFSPTRLLIDGNTYDFTAAAPWACDLSRAEWVNTPQEWQKLGFDAHSVMPQ